MRCPISFYALHILLILALIGCPSLGDQSLETPVSSGTICKFTPDQSYCKSFLPKNKFANVYGYGRFSVAKSLSQSYEFLNIVNDYLSNSSSSLSTSMVQALQDCHFLASLSTEYISTSFQTINTTAKILPSSIAEEVQTLLSAFITCQQTCLDGLQTADPSSDVTNSLSNYIFDSTKLHSVSLALFTKGWVPDGTKSESSAWYPTRRLPRFRHGKRVDSQTSSGIPNRKRLLQAGSGNVSISNFVIVSQDGCGNYTTINDAIAAAPNNSNGANGYFMIYITAGVYEEYVSIGKNKAYLILIGDGINQTIITGNHSVADGWTTFNSATFAVVASNFIAVDITFRNTAGAIKYQAVAVRNGADLSTFYSCSFEGYQDTLYSHSMRQFYRECDVYGTVDYIFGNSAVVFQNCNLYPRQPIDGQFNTITAQGRTDPNQNTGISVQNCTITPAQDLVSSNYSVETYLGRPWKQYSRTIYMESYMDSFINPAGWHNWNGDFALNTSYYAEFDNWGPGSNTTDRVTWPGYHVINATVAVNFTVSVFLSGNSWLPQTGVPYYGGLI